MVEASAWKARTDTPDYDETRRRLVDAAEVIVREEGVGALRLDAVAERVGLHRSSVYRYVANKEELITALVVQTSLRTGSEVTAALSDRDDPEALLVDGIAEGIVAVRNDPVHRSLLDPAASEAVTRIAGTALTEGLRPLVQPLFDAAAERGVLRAGVSADDATRWIMIVTSGMLHSPHIVPDGEELRGLLRTMLVPALVDER